LVPTLQAASEHDALELLADGSAGVGSADGGLCDAGDVGDRADAPCARNGPRLPVVFVITGYADTTDLDGRDEAILLQKPFRINELAAAIESAVQRSAPRPDRPKSSHWSRAAR
jgi:hypothetical protein